MLPNGEIIDSSFLDDMSEEGQTAWFDNMMASDPSDIETGDGQLSSTAYGA